MDTPVLIACAVGVLLLLALLTALLLRGRAETRRVQTTAQAETAALRERLEELSTRLESTSAALVETREQAWLITDAGEPPARSAQPAVRDRVVLSATVGEPLVKVVAFGHGLRRALSAESRNRIWFEMKREVRRTRKQRRREMKDAWRRMQADERAAQEATQQPAGSASAA